MTFSEQLKADIALIEPALEKYLSRETDEGYDRIFEAAKYSAMAGGKRLRPVIVLEFCRLCGGDIEKTLPFACALEMIHTYSLIHDDLPCMDNDDLRRGRPTCHKAFDEATAVLAGDGLLTAAFETASAAKDVPAETIVRCIRILGENAGMNGMIGGQVMDLANENRSVTAEILTQTDALKTSALLEAACRMGAIVAGANENDISTAGEYAYNLGIAFQIVDDILDVTGEEKELGKPIGSDAASGKNTFVSLLTLDGAQALAQEYTNRALAALKKLPDSGFLQEFTEELLFRRK